MSREILTKEEQQLQEAILSKLNRHFGRTMEDATENQIYKAVSLCLRDDIMLKWRDFKKDQRKAGYREVYYLSIEFLMGRSLANNLLNMGLTESYRKALSSLDIKLEDIIQCEPDAGLGNGGLGRLAACFADSMAALGLPAFGSSIRYEYGLFKQKIVDGYQIEMPDPWLGDGSSWEIAKPEEQVIVRFGGRVKAEFGESGMNVEYEDAQTVIGIPYDVPVCGMNSNVVNTLRLWSAKSPMDLDLHEFSEGNFIKAIENKALSEVLSKVLYPEDNHAEGKALRLKQQYFFVSCTMQWIMRRFKRLNGNDMSKFADKVVIHINDTHPALAIPELMRILLDEENMGWDDAWAIVEKVFAYTNHTILSEALEKWSIHLVSRLLPRIWMIIDEINRRLEQSLLEKYGQDWGKINYMAVVAYGYISMANLCVSSCFAINGVSKLHTDILTSRLFSDYYYRDPEKFHAITNGITFRRWIRLSNPRLAALIDRSVGTGWEQDSDVLRGLEKFTEQDDFLTEFMEIKRANKKRLAAFLKETNDIDIDINSMFDVQIKRLHEYKRQLLNALYILYMYNEIKANPEIEITPRTIIFGAKASPGYARAKLIIKLINQIGNLVNDDPDVNGRLKVIFVENYGVSLAQMIVTAADLSQQISTAGKEASGTGNMKLMLNGALTVGTMDGANVEMSDLLGEENIYIFGMNAKQVSQTLEYREPTSQSLYSTNMKLKKVIDMLIDGSLSPENPRMFYDLYHALLIGDHNNADEFMVVRDFDSYTKIQAEIDKDYADKKGWAKKAVMNVAAAGYFSSDRTIKEYNNKIWKAKMVPNE